MGKDKIKKVDLSFEQALEQLENITKGLEQGSMSLADAVESYSKGVELKECAMDHLNKAKLKIKVVGELDQIGDFKAAVLEISADLADKLAELLSTKSRDGFKEIINTYIAQITELFESKLGGVL
jgi:exodeoxyribonuclease VII small subunit